MKGTLHTSETPCGRNADVEGLLHSATGQLLCRALAATAFEAMLRCLELLTKILGNDTTYRAIEWNSEVMRAVSKGFQVHALQEFFACFEETFWSTRILSWKACSLHLECYCIHRHTTQV